MVPWSEDLKGELHEHVVTSEALRGNPLGDPHERPLWVHTPPGYGDHARYPTIYIIQGYCGTISMWRNRTPFRRTLPELIDALFAREDVAPALVVYVDAWTGYGGSQYLDSPAIGAYHTYLCDDVVAWVDEHYRTLAHRDARAITGKSSGGYGAMVTAMLRPDLFGAFATHAGDALFDASYTPSFPRLARRLRDEFGGSYDTFLEYFRNCEVPLLHELDELLIETYGYAAAYSSDADGTVHVPFDPATGRLIPEIWQRWLAWDPVRMAAGHAEALRSMRAIWIDAGRRDEYYLDLGASAFHQALTDIGVSPERMYFELFDGTHARIEYRYPPAIAWLTGHLTTEDH
ncbi:alpha/beta hydrolase-fold protein [Actinomadura citrea]|uniref:alpha/beta hydrolase n=1 Tax=Actinomadura citrea TaxID=46158 RepID=UPI002E288460|nr:alpha/beta hydrolase-fold protein [Actinomadura citrea]